MYIFSAKGIGKTQGKVLKWPKLKGLRDILKEIHLNGVLKNECFRKNGSLPKRKKSFPKEEPVRTLKSQKTRGSPQKRRNCLPRRSHTAGDLKRLPPASKSSSSKKKQKL